MYNFLIFVYFYCVYYVIIRGLLDTIFYDIFDLIIEFGNKRMNEWLNIFLLRGFNVRI